MPHFAYPLCLWVTCLSLVWCIRDVARYIGVQVYYGRSLIIIFLLNGEYTNFEAISLFRGYNLGCHISPK